MDHLLLLLFERVQPMCQFSVIITSSIHICQRDMTTIDFLYLRLLQISFSLMQRLLFCRTLSMATKHSNRLETFGTNENDPIYEATVQSIVSLSPTVKQFMLTLNDQSKTFQFQPGMFLDFYFSPQITSIITGFSICNSPGDYQRENRLELAIKRTDYPPTKYMFDRCSLNEKIFVKPGGKFFYHSNLTNDDSVLLICAGIGANPIVSMLRHLRDLYDEHRTGKFPHRIAFFYTAATKEDLVFRRSIDSSCQTLIRDNVLRTHYFVTREINNDDTELIYRRIHQEDLSRTIEWLEKPVTTYLCGPPSFIHWTEETLKKFHLNKIFFEKWW